MYGAMLHIGKDGTILGVTDAESVLREYALLLSEQGKPLPLIPTGGAMSYRSPC
jgi:2,4'-dihydroxyacetophenone dioxygenase